MANRMTQAKEKPAPIIMDIMMPIKNGIQACQEIKSNPETWEIPVVMVTGFDSESNKQFASCSGSSGYMTKPFTPQEFKDTVGKVLEKLASSANFG